MNSLFRAAYLTIAVSFLCTGATGCDDAQPYNGPDAVDTDGSDGSEECETFECLVPDTCGDGTCQGDESFHLCPGDCTTSKSVARTELLRGTLTHFPDDLLTTVDDSTDTGVRVDMAGQTESYVEGMDFILAQGVRQLAGIDGFGLSAGGYFTFSKSIDPTTVPSGPETAELGTSVIMGYVTEDGVMEVLPVETSVAAVEPTLTMRPMYPLPGGAHAFMALTDDVLGTTKLPTTMSPELFQVMQGFTPAGWEDVAPRMQDVADMLVAAGYIDSRDNLTALSVFTTQAPIPKSVRIADNVRSAPRVMDEVLGCETKTLWEQCTFTFDAPNYRDSDFYIDDNTDGTPTETYQLKGEVFLPLPSEGSAGPPYPTIIFGHGLTQRREDGDLLAKYLAPEGWATVVIDAPQHGEHPSAESTDQIGIFFDLFGITSTSDGLFIDGRVLRDGWRQSNYDKLTLVEVIKSGVDLDNDGIDELDPTKIMYLGASMGAIQGPEFLMLDTEMLSGMLAVGGARVTDIVRVGEQFGPAVGIVLEASGEPSDKDKYYVWLQTMADPGDPAAFAANVLENRPYGDTPPDIAAQISVPDEVVANPTSMLLARAMGIPLTGKVVLPIPLVPELQAPLVNNHRTGLTVGMVELDWLWSSRNNDWKATDHSNSPDSEEGAVFWVHFIATTLAGAPEILDPYAQFDRPIPRPE